MQKHSTNKDREVINEASVLINKSTYLMHYATRAWFEILDLTCDEDTDKYDCLIADLADYSNKLEQITKTLINDLKNNIKC